LHDTLADVQATVYLRQSQDRTGDELGISRQREDCLALAGQRGWEVATVRLDNDTSAFGRRTRSGFEALLDDIETGRAGAVIAWSLDRLTRNRRDTVRLIEACERHAVHIALVRGSDIDMSTPAGRLSADILASVARHEIEQKSDRQRRAVEQAVQQGRRVGGRRPFGYSIAMRPLKREAAAVRWAYAELLAGASLGSIARNWNARGLHTPQGRRDGTPSTWTPQVVSRTLRKPTYAGLRSHRGKVVGPAVWPALVDESTWRAAQAVLSDPSRRRPGGEQALLTGLARCGACGLTVHSGGASTGRGYRVYRCRSMAHVNRRAEPIEDYVQRVVIERLSRPDAADLLTVNDRPDVGALHAEADGLRRRIDALADDLGLDELTLARRVRALRAKLAEVEAKLTDAGRVDVLGDLVTGDVATTWAALSDDRRRAVIEVLMTVTLLPPGRGSRVFDPETVQITWRQH
jgi:site-specific DNA recombinase